MLSLGDRCNLAFVTGGGFVVAGFFYAGLGVAFFFVCLFVCFVVFFWGGEG